MALFNPDGRVGQRTRPAPGHRSGLPSSKLASRIGYRPVLLAGAASWAVGSAALALAVGRTPHWLPYLHLLGLGFGLTLPVQSGALAAFLHTGQHSPVYSLAGQHVDVVEVGKLLLG